MVTVLRCPTWSTTLAVHETGDHPSEHELEDRGIDIDPPLHV